jgi:uncharacterized membrane protein
MIDTILFFIIVLIEFFVLFFEYDTWRMNKERYAERKTWRVAKQKQKLGQVVEKVEPHIVGPASQ